MRICSPVHKTISQVGIYEKEAQTKRNKHKKVTRLFNETKQRKKITMEHLRALSIFFFIFSYLTAFTMLFADALFLRFGGVALFAFLSHQLVEQYYLKK
jgi:nicotinamide riboside transporter PnuC